MGVRESVDRCRAHGTEMCPGGQAKNASHNGQPETALAFIGEKQGNDVVIILENDADYAEAVNNGHRIVSHGKTVGKTDGRLCWSRGRGI